jgi:hypothetical protein
MGKRVGKSRDCCSSASHSCTFFLTLPSPPGLLRYEIKAPSRLLLSMNSKGKKKIRKTKKKKKKKKKQSRS